MSCENLKRTTVKIRKCKHDEFPKLKHVYFIENYTSPKLFNGSHFECLLTDQLLEPSSKIIDDLGHINNYKFEIWKPERFGINKRLFKK
jgi:hypothetical protein